MIRCIAIDDEPLALEILQSYCSKVPFLQLEQCFTNPLEALPKLQELRPDLLFLDIEMPQISGIQLIKSLPHIPHLILITAYPQYALQGYELDVTDYLLKPMAFDRFLKAVMKVQERMKLNASLPESAPIPAGSTPIEAPDTGYIFIKSDYKTIRIDLKDILLIEGLKDYLAIHVPGKKVLTLLSMANLLEKLPAKEFVRVHRSFIVPLSKIESIEKHRIRIGSHLIPVSETYREELQTRIK